MSMDDILKLLVESRQPTERPSPQSDPMTELIGGLLGGGETAGGGQADAIAGMLGNLLGGSGQASSQAGMGQSNAMAGMLDSLLGGSPSQMGGQQTGLSGLMSLLEMFTAAGGQSGLGQPAMASSPLTGLLQPLVEPLAKKLKIPPELAMVVISFVLQKLLAHHPTSGRDSTQFDLDDLFNQLSATGKINPNILQNSGMVEELSRLTGLDQATATKSLNTAFTMVGQRALHAAAKPISSKPAGRTLKSAASSRKKITR